MKANARLLLIIVTIVAVSHLIAQLEQAFRGAAIGLPWMWHFGIALQYVALMVLGLLQFCSEHDAIGYCREAFSPRFTGGLLFLATVAGFWPATAIALYRVFGTSGGGPFWMLSLVTAVVCALTVAFVFAWGAYFPGADAANTRRTRPVHRPRPRRPVHH